LLSPEFLSAEMKRAQRKDALNLDVWDYIMRASSYHGRYTKDDATEAQRFLLKAIKLDPLSSEAFCLLAFTQLMQVQFGWSESRAKSIKESLCLCLYSHARYCSDSTDRETLYASNKAIIFNG